MTVRDLVDRSGRIAGVLASGETFSGQEATDALATLNGVLESWSTDGLSIFRETREEFALIANQRSYDFGSTLDFNSQAPALISNVGILVGSGVSEVEYPCEIINADQRAQIALKGLTSQIPQFVYIRKVDDYIRLDFYPTPSTANDVAIYSTKPITPLTSMNDVLNLPIGYKEALTYAVAVDFGIEYQKQLSEMTVMKANELKAGVMRRNTNPVLLSSDVSGQGFQQDYMGYNINLDNT